MKTVIKKLRHVITVEKNNNIKTITKDDKLYKEYLEKYLRNRSNELVY